MNEIVKKEESVLLPGVTKLDDGMFAEEGVSKITTLDLNNEVDAERYLNCQSEVKFLKDYVGQTINVIGVSADERKSISSNFDEETGEAFEKTSFKHILIFHGDDGNDYLTASNSCYKSFALIVQIKKMMPTKENPMKLVVYNQPAKENKDHNFLKVKLAK